MSRRGFFNQIRILLAIKAGLFGLPSSVLAEIVTGNQAEDVVQSTLEKVLEPLLVMLQDSAWLQGGLVILVTICLASLVSWLLFKLVKAVTKRTKMTLDDEIALKLRPPIYYSLLVSGILYGLSLLPLTQTLHLLAARSVRTAGAVIWILAISKITSLVLARLAELSDRFPMLQRRTLTLFDNGAKMVIFSLGIYVVFLIWAIDMTAWLASAGIVGIAVGFAAKDTLSNLFSGVFILADAPYKVGDYIVLDRGERGKVTHIGLRSTRILTRDEVEITIPNLVIGNSTIINQSGGPSEKLRLRIKVGVAYGSDVDKVKEILLTIAKSQPLVEREPSPRVRFRVFGASSLDLELLCWIRRPELRGRAVDALNYHIYQRFTEEGVEIPYSKQDLYIKTLPADLLPANSRLAGTEGYSGPAADKC